VDARREREDSTQRYGEREQQSRHGLINDHERPMWLSGRALPW
jgi:hypothetical protein